MENKVSDDVLKTMIKEAKTNPYAEYSREYVGNICADLLSTRAELAKWGDKEKERYELIISATGCSSIEYLIKEYKDTKASLSALQERVRWIPIDNGPLPDEGQLIFVLKLSEKVIDKWYFTRSLLPAFAKYDYWIPTEKLLPLPPEEK